MVFQDPLVRLATITHDELVSPKAFHDWASHMPPTPEGLQAACRAIAQHASPEASLRCAHLALKLMAWSEVNAYLLEARLRANGGHEDLPSAIRVLESLRELSRSRAENRVTSSDGPANVLALLERVRSDLGSIRETRPFSLEHEYRALLGIANVYHKRGEATEALLYAEEALGLANTLEVPFLISNARAIIVSLLVNAGRFTEAHAENVRLQDQRDEQIPMERDLLADAELKFRFGFFEEALQIVQAQEIAPNQREQTRDFYRVMLGTFDPRQTPVARPKFAGFLLGLRELIALNGTVITSASEQHVTRVATAIMQALPREDEFPSGGQRALRAFLTAKARLLRRDYTLVASSLEHQVQSTDEPDVFIALVAAVKLESSMHPQLNPYISLSQRLESLRRIIDRFERYSFASKAGLARLLTYWTPLAAAFLALLPEPPGCFLAAQTLVLRTQQGMSFVHDVQIPNVVAIEQVLLGMGLNLRLLAVDTPNLNERQKTQRDTLFATNGEALYFRPVVSVGLIVYALVRLAHEKCDPQYREWAITLYRQFGLFPNSNANYANHLQATVAEAFNELLSTTGSLEKFVLEITSLRHP
jgi:hypothetical protein